MTKSNDALVVYQDTSGKFRWRRVAMNGQNVSSPGQGYTRKFTALKAALSRNRDIMRTRVYNEAKGERKIVESVLIERYLGEV